MSRDLHRSRTLSAPLGRAVRLRIGAALVCGLLLLTACYSDDSSSKQGAAATPAPQDIYPTGILSTRDAKGTIAGVYPVSSAEAQSCCWLGPEARFRVFADPGVRTVRLTVYEPKMGNLATAHQRVSLLDMNGRVFSSRPIATGLQTVLLPVPKDIVGSGAASVRLRMSTTIVPKDAGVNGDTRALSVILQQVSAQ